MTERKWLFKLFFILVVSGTGLTAAVGGALYWQFSQGLPEIINVDDYKPNVVSQVFATGGKEPVLISEFYGEQRRYLVPYDRIPQSVVRAFISAEDDQFFQHPGINIGSIIRASIANFRAGHVVQGGSTITQQVTKSLLLTSERSFGRKIREVILASRLERHLTKQQILYLYLNEIYLGHGAYGVQAAAKTYFRKDVSELTVAEAAVLAGLPQAPSKYSPVNEPGKAKERQKYVLRRMMETGFITRDQMLDAVSQPIRIYDDEEVTARVSPYWIEHVRRHLLEKYGKKAVYEQGLRVELPISVDVGVAASKSLRSGLEAIDKRIGYRGPIQKLKNAEEIEQFLKDYRGKLILKKLEHQVLTTDGRLDAYEAMKLAGLQSDSQLLKAGENYQAVVTSVDARTKKVGVMIGAALADLPADQMKWARANFAKGDVILVKVLDSGDKGLTVALEQEPQVQGALFSLEVQTGRVIAMEGGYDFEKSEFNRAIQAQRQPGSSFKPIIYAAAVEKGYTPATVIVDSPIVYEDGESGKWKPANFEEKFYGDTTFRQALIKSRNVPTIKIVQALQVSHLIDFAKRLGMNGQFPADLSISLGSAAISLAEITKSYALFPRLGRKVNPAFLSRVLDRQGNILEETKPDSLPEKPVIRQAAPSPVPVGANPALAAATPQPSPTAATTTTGLATLNLPTFPLADDPDQLLDPRVAFVMTNLMKEVVTHGTGHAAQSLGRPAAGKTGTTNEYLDAWFVGFTPNVVTGVWVGYDNQKPLGSGETGAKAALPIWLSFMTEAVKAYPNVDFIVPPGVVFASIDPTTGKLAPQNSASSIKEAFIEGTEPTEASEKSAASPDLQGNFFKEDTE